MLSEEALKLPETEFNKYIESVILNDTDAIWLEYWRERAKSAFWLDPEEMIITARLTHYLGFLSGLVEGIKSERNIRGD